ncbi:unnamed protein product [Macrosiphum euphorbiae]|uniref:HAT C-terminal dimerisation domain-containing protein n=2 Tax=Macrosiphum euphorbiae TaxID=13131 RepID=A0AAV0VL47_9HEMI|nr:unnamed protein product [Macrosiphum euphorbiae]CAI6350284.1 unnamed protein product [Macrosiphum euphorbiae]CAI6359515.1 unnamed protein product [Macrosiphum euphorbiae]
MNTISSIHDVKAIYALENCVISVFNLLHLVNLHLPTYSNLYATMEYVLTLSVSQVNCERVISKLKIIKNRLRASLDDRFDAFLLMSVEKDILNDLEFEDILEFWTLLQIQITYHTLSKLLSYT